MWGQSAPHVMGFYHYATGATPEKEAQMFVKHTSSYFGYGIPCIDWEQIQNKAWGNKEWVYRFCKEVYSMTKVWPMIYVQRSAISQVANCVDKCPLWVAAYYDERDNFNAPKFVSDISPWKSFTVWQFSSSNDTLDRNVANVTREGWLKIAKGNTTVSHQINDNNSSNNNSGSSRKSIERLAAEVILGMWGVGKTRKQLLLNEGYDYDKVQEYINKLYKVANDVIKGKYGNGDERKENLKKAGYDPGIVQYIVNDILA